MWQSYPGYDINGAPPQMAGRICEEFICEGYIYQGEAVCSANVTYLKFSGAWYRLYFEPEIIFWRPFDKEPTPYSVEEEGWSCPHSDVAALSGVKGKQLDHYKISFSDNELAVTFKFVGGNEISIIETADDRTDFHIENSSYPLAP
ncbi:hypothetical protein [Labrys neptuniae]